MRECSISLSSAGGFALTIPSPAGGDQVINVPADLNGLRLIRKILSARKSHHDPRLGSWAEPAQSMIDHWLLEDRAKKENERAERLLRDDTIVLEL